MSTLAAFAPFDLFGNAGTGRGAELLADALREMLADNRREERAVRAAAYQPHVKLKELAFATPADYADWRPRCRKLARSAWARGDFLLWCGGNHLSCLPLYDELAGDDTALVVQFDAHLDVYNLADCTEELSHGNFLRFCAGPLPPVVNLGHRDLFLPESGWRPFFRAAVSAEAFTLHEDDILTDLRRRAKRAKRVLIDLDCDALDPSYFPAVGQPQPFGLTPLQLLKCLDAVWSDRVIGVAISEFDPARDDHDRSLGTLIWLLEWLLLRRYEPTAAPGREV